MMRGVDATVREQSLEELDGEHWEEPADATSLIRECLRLRKVPIGQLTAGDLRLLLGQRIGTAWLVPLALERLAEEPLAGEWYPGDLLNAVLQADATYWADHPTEVMKLWRVRESLEKVRADAEKLLADDRWPAFGRCWSPAHEPGVGRLDGYCAGAPRRAHARKTRQSLLNPP
jgi:hypothetical protein